MVQGWLHNHHWDGIRCSGKHNNQSTTHPGGKPDAKPVITSGTLWGVWAVSSMCLQVPYLLRVTLGQRNPIQRPHTIIPNLHNHPYKGRREPNIPRNHGQTAYMFYPYRRWNNLRQKYGGHGDMVAHRLFWMPLYIYYENTEVMFEVLERRWDIEQENIPDTVGAL